MAIQLATLLKTSNGIKFALNEADKIGQKTISEKIIKLLETNQNENDISDEEFINELPKFKRILPIPKKIIEEEEEEEEIKESKINIKEIS